MTFARWIGISAAAAIATVSVDARSDDRQCMDAASKGQEVRDEGKLIEAKAYFEKCADPTCPAPIPGYCADWLAEARRKTPSIVIRAVDANGRDVTDATAQIDEQRAIAIDGRAIEVDPGKHKLRIKRAAAPTFEEEIVVAQGEKDRVVVAKLAATTPVAIVAPPPEAPATSKRGGVPTASLVAWGIGGAALLSFAGFGLKAKLDYDDYESRCGSRCAPSERDTVASSVTIADVSLVVGLLAAGVGTVFYLLRPEPARAEARR